MFGRVDDEYSQRLTTMHPTKQLNGLERTSQGIRDHHIVHLWREILTFPQGGFSRSCAASTLIDSAMIFGLEAGTAAVKVAVIPPRIFCGCAQFLFDVVKGGSREWVSICKMDRYNHEIARAAILALAGTQP